MRKKSKKELSEIPEFRALPEEAREELARRTKAIREHLKKMEEARAGQFRALAALIGDPGETDRTRLIWKGITRFANEDFSRDTKGILGVFALRAALALCVHTNNELDDISGAVFALDFFDDVCRLQETEEISREKAFSILAEALQPQLRLILSWIADPTRLGSEERKSAFDFLLENGEQQFSLYEYSLNDQFDITGAKGPLFLYWKEPRVFDSIAVPITRFIFQRLELFHEGHLELDKAVPIVLCRREGCGNFTVALRNRKIFCTDSCRSLHGQKEHPERYAASVRRWRKKKYMELFPRRAVPRSGGGGAQKE